MDSDRFAEIAKLFDSARERPPHERAGFVKEHAGGDDELAEEVLDLLSHHDDPSRALDTPMMEQLAENDADDQEPEAIGRYRIIRRLGAGGMGVVYLAEQDAPKRTVALKLLKQGFGSAEARHRFRHEAEVLGRLQHPGVAQIYDAGTASTAHGQAPYFVMEYVKGEPIDDSAAGRGLGIRERLGLLIDVCSAVQHAHQHGVIHRDLKPGNILVDGEGRPRILDFGVARSIDAEQRATLMTDVGQLVGTLAYMSPEQVSGRPELIDTRSDVYALGVLAFELLSDRLPHEMRGESMAAAIRAIESVEPPRLGNLRRACRGDLETIVSKALEKNADRRYESAAELAADLQRHLDDQPILARPPSTFYQFSKLARRNPVATVTTILLAIVLVTSAVGGTALAIWALDERDTAIAARGEQKRLAEAEKAARDDEQAQREIAEARADEAEANLRLARWNEYLASLAAADAAYRAFDQVAGRSRLFGMDEAYRGNWEWLHLAARFHSMVYRVRHESVRPDGSRSNVGVECVDIAASGKLMMTGCRDGSVRFIRTDTGAMVGSGSVHTRSVASVELFEDARLAVSCGHDGRVVVLETSSGAVRAHWQLVSDAELDERILLTAAVPLPEDRIAVARNDGLLEIWHWPTMQRERAIQVAQTSFSFDRSPDGRRFAVATISRTLLVIDVATGEDVVRVSMEEPVRDIAWSPDGRYIATASEQFVRTWHAETGQRHGHMRGLTGTTRALCYTPNGRQLVTGSHDGTIRLWNAETGIEEQVLLGHSLPVTGVAVSADGRWIASSSQDSTAGLIDPRLVPLQVAAVDRMSDVATSPADGVVAMGLTNGEVALFDVETAEMLHRWRGDRTQLRCVDYDSEGRWLVIGGASGAQVWDALTCAPTIQLTDASVGALDAAPGDARVALGLADGRLRIHDLNTGSLLRERTLDDASIGQIAWFGAGDDRLAIGTYSGAVLVWDVSRDEIVMETQVPDGWRIEALAPDITGDRVLGHHGHVVIGWRVSDGGEAFRLGSSRSPITSMLFNSDGSRLVVGSADGTIRMYEPASGDVVLVLRGHGQAVSGLAWAAGHEVLASASRDGLRLWDTRLPSARRQLRDSRQTLTADFRSSLESQLEADGVDATFQAIIDDTLLDVDSRAAAIRALGELARERRSNPGTG